jgi:hypothetical protein
MRGSNVAQESIPLTLEGRRRVVARSPRWAVAAVLAVVVGAVGYVALTGGDETAVERRGEPATVADTQGATERARSAEAARWTALAETHLGLGVLSRAQTADASRWTALAEALVAEPGLSRVSGAEAARWTALAEFFGGSDGLSRGLRADALRWTALARLHLGD